MGFQMVLDDSDSMVSIICTDSSQHGDSGNIFSAPRSVDTGHAFGLVLEALARMRGATWVRTSVSSSVATGLVLRPYSA